MIVFMKRFFAIFLVFGLIACVGNENGKDVPRVVQKSDARAMVISEEGEVIFSQSIEENEKIKSQNLERAYSLSDYDATPIYKQVEKSIQKVEIVKSVIKPKVDVEKYPRHLTNEDMEMLLKNVLLEEELSDEQALDNNAKVLVENYKNIIKTSEACCVGSIADKLKAGQATKDSIVGFLANDVSGYSVQNMCMVLSDDDISMIFSNRNLVGFVKRAKIDCICNNAEFLKKNLNNFYGIYRKNPDFYNAILVYRFTDKNGRVVKQDMNETVYNISNVLSGCPKR